MSRQVNIALPLTLVIVLGFCGVWKLQHGIDAQRTAMHQEQDDLVLRSGKMLKVLSLEYAPLIADIYWTRAVQYYGGKQVDHDPKIDLLWPLLDVTTTLDPHLLPAYRFGSIFLSQPPPSGAGRPDLGIELIQRGIRENPEYWRFYQDLGFIYYFNLKDYTKASEAFLEGSKKPGAMIWMKVMAARVAELGQTRETSMFLWNEIYNSNSSPDIKQNALTHMRLLRAESDCDALDTLAAEYEKQTGRRPAAMRDLVSSGLLARIPVDPLGIPYVFDKDGKAQLNPEGQLAKDKPNYERSF